jgi:hypothetical protein
MRTCKADNDCRGSYQCIDISLDAARHVVDNNPSSQHICSVPSSSPPSSVPPPRDPPVCYPSDASFDVNRPEAGPISRDASADAAADESAADGIADRGESNITEAGEGSPGDVLDSSRVEAGGDATGDPVEDALDEPPSDAPAWDSMSADAIEDATSEGAGTARGR